MGAAETSDAVVVFGATGFVGRNFCARHGGDFEIIAVSRSGAAVPGSARAAAMDDLDALGPLPPGTVVVNLAAHRYDAGRFDAAQAELLSANLALVDRVYRFCLARGIKEVRAASSVAVYPATAALLDDQAPLDLNAAPHPNEAFYAWSKRWAEVTAGLYRDRYGVSTVSFRLSNPYGPHDSTDVARAHVLPAFVIKALTPAPTFEIKGDPRVERDFIFVDDVCDAFAQSLSLRGRTEAVNLCTGRSTSLADLAGLILKLAGEDRAIVTTPPTVAGPAARPSANAGLIALLGPRDFTPLAEGLPPTLEWYRHALGA